MFTAGITSNLSPVITLSVYTGIAFCTGKDPLSEAQTFMSLSIIILASTPLSNLVYSAPKVTGAIECFQRIQEYLSKIPRQDYRNTSCFSHNVSKTSGKAKGSQSLEMERMPSQNLRSPKSGSVIVLFHQADFGWNANASILSNISMKLIHGSFTMVIGPVGSGKSVLLKAILGELDCTKSYVQIQPSLTVSFCDTNPWIRSKSIRETIVGPLDYDEKWYHTVIKACALDEDIKDLPEGHSTVIGSNGTSISGGQRQRLAIARAVYARTQLALFDDVLSALDARTYERVFNNVFGRKGLLRQNEATVVLVTHSQNMNYADQIVSLDEGRISAHGSPSEFVPSDELLSNGHISSQIEPAALSGPRVDNHTIGLSSSHGIERAADRKRGEFINYAYYLYVAGSKNMLLYVFCLFIGAFCSQFPSKSILSCLDELIST